jgi:Enolase
MDYLEIEKVVGREILDSRGNPTVEAEITLGCLYAGLMIKGDSVRVVEFN